MYIIHALYIILYISIYCRRKTLRFVSASRWQVDHCFPRHGEYTDYSPKRCNRR